MSDLVVDRVSMVFSLPGGSIIETLKDISLTMGDGEMVSVPGPSGCGKPTLPDILAGLLAPIAGNVRLGDKPVVGPDRARCMVFQVPGPTNKHPCNRPDTRP